MNRRLQTFLAVLFLMLVLVTIIGIEAVQQEGDPIGTPTMIATVEPTAVNTADPTPTQEVRTQFEDCQPIGFNVNGFAVNNWSYFKERNQQFMPCVTLIMDDSGKALELVRDQPGTFVVFRSYHRSDGNACLVLPPETQVREFIDTFRNKAREMGMNENSYQKIGLYGCSNEPSFGSTERLNRIIDAEIEFMRLTRENGITSVSGNWAVGTVAPELVDNGTFDRWIRACNQYDCVMAFHEYTTDFLPFGVGAYQRQCVLDDQCVQPENWVDVSYIQAERWFPSQAYSDDLSFGEDMLSGYYFAADAQSAEGFLPPYYHLFRFLWIQIRAKEIGEEIAPVIITEGLHDRLDDMRIGEVDVLHLLELEYGIDIYMDDIRGAPSHCRLWEEYYWEEQTCAESLMMQYEWYTSILLAHPEFNLWGVTVFTWSQHEHWMTFNVDETEPVWNGREFHGLLAEFAQRMVRLE